RADESKQVIDYLTTDIFGASARGNARGRSVTVGELLDQADATVAERFRRQPLVEASIRMALARSYFYLGDIDRTARHSARAGELRARTVGRVHPATLEALAEQAWDLCNNGWVRSDGWESRVEAAEAIGRRVLAARRRVLGLSHAYTLWSQVILAMTVSHLGRPEEAEALAAQAEQLAVTTFG